MAFTLKLLLVFTLFVKCNAFSFLKGIENLASRKKCENINTGTWDENPRHGKVTAPQFSMGDPSRRNAFSIFTFMITSISARPPKCLAVSESSGVQSFLGTYSDPINHPGGKRAIKLVDGAIVGDYALAKVYGGGGLGEPREYILPALIVGDRAIIIDFTPKGGPRDFSGVLEKDGSIRFLKDGNRWPRID